jgi:hypothetical protein
LIRIAFAGASAVPEFTARLAAEPNAIVDAFGIALQAASANHGNQVKPEDGPFDPATYFGFID